MFAAVSSYWADVIFIGFLIIIVPSIIIPGIVVWATLRSIKNKENYEQKMNLNSSD